MAKNQKPSNMRQIDLLLFDKDPLTNSALEVLLEDDDRLHIAGNARSEEEAFKLLSERTPDVVLMDINVSNKTCFRPLQSLKRHYPQQKVLALLYEDEEVIEGVVNSGAEGYFLKDRDLGELPEAIAKVHKKGGFRPNVLGFEEPDPEKLLALQQRDPFY